MCKRRHIPELDGLRGLAVIFVLLAHSPFTMFEGYGGFGVTVFFVLSGFLITRILLDEKQKGVPLRAFLLRRSARIFPAYYLLLLLCGLWGGWDGMTYAALYIYNWSPNELVLPAYLGHTWSLCVEEQFYLLWPLVVTFLPASRKIAVRLLVYCIAFYPLFELFAPAWGYGNYTTSLMYRATPFNAVPLLIGCTFAYSEDRLRACLEHKAIPTILIVFVILYFWNYKTAMIASEIHTSIKSWNRIAAANALFLFGLSPLASGIFNLKPLRWCGSISYGLYLYHFPVYHGLLGFKGIWFTLPGTFAIAATSYYLFESPIRHVGYKLSARIANIKPATSTASVEQ